MIECIWFISHLIHFIHVSIKFLLVNHLMHLFGLSWISSDNLSKCLYLVSNFNAEVYSLISEDELKQCYVQNLEWNLNSEQDHPEFGGF